MTKYKHLLNSDLYNLKHRKIFLHFTEPLSDLINASNARLADALKLSQELRQDFIPTQKQGEEASWLHVVLEEQ